MVFAIFFWQAKWQIINCDHSKKWNSTMHFCIEIDYSLHFMKLIKIPKDVEGRRWRRLWLFYISSFFMPFSRDDNGAWKGGGQVWEMNGRSRIPHLRAWGLRLLTICIYICIASRRWFMRSVDDSPCCACRLCCCTLTFRILHFEVLTFWDVKFCWLVFLMN